MKKIKFNNRSIAPSKIVCIGRNYIEHIEELKNEVPQEPVIFLKPNSAISNHIQVGTRDAVHYEAELTFLIDKGGLSGVGFGLDLTKREIQNTLKSKGLPWERAKCFDGAAVFSEFVTMDGNIDRLSVELYINGELKQLGKPELMLYKPLDIIKHVESFLSFENSDLLMSGTPKGVGRVNIGDSFTGRVLQDTRVLIERSWRVES